MHWDLHGKTVVMSWQATGIGVVFYIKCDGYPASLSFPIMHQVHVICTQYLIATTHYHKMISPTCQTIHYDRSQYCALFFISNIKVSRTNAALWVDLCNVYSILVSVLIGVHPLKFPSLSISLPPTLLPVPLPLSVAPSHLTHFLPPFFPSLCPCLAPFLPHSSLPHPSFPSSTSAPTLPHIIDSSLPPLVPSLPHPPLLPPSHLSSFLALFLPPYLPARE